MHAQFWHLTRSAYLSLTWADPGFFLVLGAPLRNGVGDATPIEICIHLIMGIFGHICWQGHIFQCTESGAHQGKPLSPLIPWVSPFKIKFIFSNRFFPQKVSYFPWRWDSSVLIGFYNSGHTESLKGDWLLQQWAYWISWGKPSLN